MRNVTLILFVVLISTDHSQEACLVTSKSSHQPVYITNNTGKYGFFLPDTNGMHFQQGEQIVLLCAGHLNRLNQTGANLTVATCANRDRFLVSNQIYNFHELECRRPVRASVIHTDEICANGYIANIGYFIEDQFLKLIEVCYDIDQGQVVYTKHVLLTSELKKFNGTYHKPSFNTKGLSPDNKSVSLVYHIEAQKVKLSSLLQSSILTSEYISNQTYLTKGHLAPDGDFALISWKYATFFFLNACPQWNTIDENNWKLIEEMVRKLRNALDEKLQIVTGTYEILELKDRLGNWKPLYLSQRWKKFPVPKYIWKIVYSEKTKKGIVLVVYNNPHEASAKYLCSTVCKTHGWNSVNWSNIRNGFIQCCSFVQFKQVVRSIPPLTITGILHGPECK
ncbi:hypothetical protein Trydic_g19078 [Trypoxylus dichotomus]